MFIRLFFLYFLVVLGITSTVKFRKCHKGTEDAPKENKIEFEHLEISGCQKRQGRQTCTISRGSTFEIDARVKFDFHSRYSTPYTLTALTNTGNFDIYIGDFCELAKPGACTHVRPDDVIKMQGQKIVDYYFPIYEGGIRLTVRDNNGNPQFCGEMDVNITEEWGKQQSSVGLINGIQIG